MFSVAERDPLNMGLAEVFVHGQKTPNCRDPFEGDRHGTYSLQSERQSQSANNRGDAKDTNNHDPRNLENSDGCLHDCLSEWLPMLRHLFGNDLPKMRLPNTQPNTHLMKRREIGKSATIASVSRCRQGRHPNASHAGNLLQAGT